MGNRILVVDDEPDLVELIRFNLASAGFRVEIATSGKPENRVTFPHKAHTQWMGCPLCHSGLFEMEKGKVKMTMTAMGEGKQCGACHGKVAAPDIAACPACHKAMGS